MSTMPGLPSMVETLSIPASGMTRCVRRVRRPRIRRWSRFSVTTAREKEPLTSGTTVRPVNDLVWAFSIAYGNRTIGQNQLDSRSTVSELTVRRLDDNGWPRRPTRIAPRQPKTARVDHCDRSRRAELEPVRTPVLALMWLVLGCSAAPPPPPVPDAAPESVVGTTVVATTPVPATAQVRRTTVAAAGTTPPSPPPAMIELDAHGLDSATDLRVSASLWIDGRGEVWSVGPEAELFPASNQKLLTAAGAYELLETNLRFTTSVVAVDRHGGVDLYLVAGGDPELRLDDLSGLAQQTAAAVASRPVRAVHVDATRFEPHRVAPGWQDWHIPTYTGPLSAFVLDDNRWSTEPDYLSDPALGNARRFIELLVDAGVAIADSDPSHASPPADHRLVATHESSSVGELIVTMLRRSDNEIAESIVREIDVRRGGVGSTRAGLEHIVGQLAQAGVRLGGTNGDGSGLSRANRRSARQWQEFLVDIRDRPWFSEFLATLPVAGQSGTLANRLRGPVTTGRVRAKTGTIIGGRALSGYITTPTGPAVFSITVNGDRSHDALAAIDAVVAEFAGLEW